MIKKILFFISLVFVVNMSYGFCVYNQTTGNHTVDVFFNKHKKIPTLIEVITLPEHKSRIVKQNDYACNTSGPRKENDHSTITIKVINVYGGIQDTRPKICTVNVYNKGGYVMVRGQESDSSFNYSCDVHRDPN